MYLKYIGEQENIVILCWAWRLPVIPIVGVIATKVQINVIVGRLPEAT